MITLIYVLIQIIYKYSIINVQFEHKKEFYKGMYIVSLIINEIMLYLKGTSIIFMQKKFVKYTNTHCT